MPGKGNSDTPALIHYLALRRAVGILGASLPFVLPLGGLLLFQTGLQSSISAYYHTGMGDYFVGTLFAIGMFLFSYKGYAGSNDDLFSNVGCLSAIGLALFPTTPDNPASDFAVTIGYVHLVFGALFFFSLIWFSLKLFTLTHPDRAMNAGKVNRNRVYRVCGYTMILCMVLIVIFYLLPAEVKVSIGTVHPVFWLEAVAIVAFGVSWLTKGRVLRMVTGLFKGQGKIA